MEEWFERKHGRPIKVGQEFIGMNGVWTYKITKIERKKPVERSVIWYERLSDGKENSTILYNFYYHVGAWKAKVIKVNEAEIFKATDPSKMSEKDLFKRLGVKDKKELIDMIVELDLDSIATNWEDWASYTLRNGWEGYEKFTLQELIDVYKDIRGL